MQRRKAFGEDQVTAGLLKDGGQIGIKKVAASYAQCLKTSTAPESEKNSNISLIHQKGDVKNSKKLQAD